MTTLTMMSVGWYRVPTVRQPVTIDRQRSLELHDRKIAHTKKKKWRSATRWGRPGGSSAPTALAF